MIKSKPVIVVKVKPVSMVLAMLRLNQLAHGGIMAKVYPVSIVKHKPVTASNPSALTHTMLFFLSITTGQHHPPCNKMERQRRRKRKGEKQREREGGTGRGKTKHGPNYPINEQLSLCSLIACAAFFLVLMVLAKRERGRERDLLNAQDCSCGVMREVTINQGGEGQPWRHFLPSQGEPRLDGWGTKKHRALWWPAKPRPHTASIT